uniref:Uncharacterized protein n=1 Tax=Timema bartmani TaxID=61472 RepID=A0A7R9F8I6_9NEOP|nr:unnamed protein product [Timema bartmani]
MESSLLAMGRMESSLLVMGRMESSLLAMERMESSLLVMGRMESSFLVMGRMESSLLVMGRMEFSFLMMERMESSRKQCLQQYVLMLAGLMTYINFMSVKLFVRVQNVFTGCKLLACVIVILGGIYELCIESYYHPNSMKTITGPDSPLGTVPRAYGYEAGGERGVSGVRVFGLGCMKKVKEDGDPKHSTAPSQYNIKCFKL